MKKSILIAITGAFLMTSCASGHSCDAYKKSDYTKHKVEKTKK